MASNNSQSTSSAAPALHKRVNERFGVLPHFFQLSPETPEITEKLWGFAEAAYLDNPWAIDIQPTLRHCRFVRPHFVVRAGFRRHINFAVRECPTAVVAVQRPLRHVWRLFRRGLGPPHLKRGTSVSE